MNTEAFEELVEYYKNQFPEMSEQDWIRMAEEDLQYEENN
jgi:hypothetical protein